MTFPLAMNVSTSANSSSSNSVRSRSILTVRPPTLIARRNAMYLATSGPEHEIDRAEQTAPRPHEVHLEGLLHVQDRERYEDRERDDLLDDLELPEIERAVPDAVRRHLQEVLEQRDRPADDRRHVPGPAAQIAQVGVPGKRHEHVRTGEQ